MAWYRTGTVSVTNGSTTVTGSGTLWVANAVAGYGIVLPDGRLYEIASVNSNTSLTLAVAYLGSTASGQAYAVAPLRGPEVKLAQDIAALINDYGAAFLAAGQGKFTTGTIAAPSVRNAADENTGLNLLGSDQLQLVTGGVARLLLTTSAATLSVPLQGTAVTQSATDATAGRLTKVGDFGLGGAGANIPTGDCNELLQSGIYSIVSATANTPTGTGPSGSMMLVQRYSGSNIMQTFWQRVSAGVVRMYVRNLFTDVWGAWREIPNMGNLLGTVSQASGVPTGAVIERGSNANGEYVRFADGTQTCNHQVTLTGGGGATITATWTFPAAFVSGSLPVINAMATTAPPAAARERHYWYGTGVSSAAINASMNANWAAETSEVHRVKAFGRWF